MDFLEACQKFIATDSSSGQGNLEAAELAASMCKEAGLEVELQHETSKGVAQANVIARTRPETGDKELLLLSPLDTVDPGSFGLWDLTDHNPFNATIREGSIFGLGSTSGKLDFLCKLEALKQFREISLKKPIVLAGTYGSTSNGAGAIRLIRRKKVNADLALVGGASGLQMFHAAKGMATVEIVVPFSKSEKKVSQNPQ